MTVFDVILTRRSIRHYSKTTIPSEDLEKILKVKTNFNIINDFDRNGTQNRRMIIRFNLKWFQDKNIIK